MQSVKLPLHVLFLGWVGVAETCRGAIRVMFLTRLFQSHDPQPMIPNIRRRARFTVVTFDGIELAVIV